MLTKSVNDFENVCELLDPVRDVTGLKELGHLLLQLGPEPGAVLILISDVDVGFLALATDDLRNEVADQLSPCRRLPGQ
jgi:hypothetical protein